MIDSHLDLQMYHLILSMINVDLISIDQYFNDCLIYFVILTSPGKFRSGALGYANEGSTSKLISGMLTNWTWVILISNYVIQLSLHKACNGFKQLEPREKPFVAQNQCTNASFFARQTCNVDGQHFWMLCLGVARFVLSLKGSKV